MNIEEMKAMSSLFRKKAAVMAALGGGMEKKGENSHFNYKFVTASDIKRTVSALLHENGLSLQMSGVATENAIAIVEVKDYATKSTRLKEVPILRIQFQISLCDVDTGAIEQSFWFGEAGAGDDKAASKAATSALKYFLISNLLIADKDEDERDTDNQKKRPSDDRKPPRSNRHENAAAPVKSPPSAIEAHWSQEEGAMDRLNGWAHKNHGLTADQVSQAIRKTRKPLIDLSREDVMNALNLFVENLKVMP